MKNLDQLMKEHSKLYDDLTTGVVDHAQGKEINNCLGKLISGSKTKLEYQVLRKEQPNIEFLDTK